MFAGIPAIKFLRQVLGMELPEAKIYFEKFDGMRESVPVGYARNEDFPVYAAESAFFEDLAQQIASRGIEPRLRAEIEELNNYVLKKDRETSIARGDLHRVVAERDSLKRTVDDLTEDVACLRETIARLHTIVNTIRGVLDIA